MDVSTTATAATLWEVLGALVERAPSALSPQQHQYRQQQQQKQLEASALPAAQLVDKQQMLTHQRSKVEVVQPPKVLPPNYDYALALKIQQTHQSQQARGVGYSRRSSEPPPPLRASMARLGNPVSMKSPSLIHRKPTTQSGAPPMQRPPLPSYQEASSTLYMQNTQNIPQIKVICVFFTSCCRNEAAAFRPKAAAAASR